MTPVLFRTSAKANRKSIRYEIHAVHPETQARLGRLGVVEHTEDDIDSTYDYEAVTKLEEQGYEVSNRLYEGPMFHRPFIEQEKESEPESKTPQQPRRELPPRRKPALPPYGKAHHV